MRKDCDCCIGAPIGLIVVFGAASFVLQNIIPIALLALAISLFVAGTYALAAILLLTVTIPVWTVCLVRHRRRLPRALQAWRAARRAPAVVS